MDKHHILIVDDDQEILTLLARALEQQGYEVDTADCLTAMHETLSKKPELNMILLDVMLPDGDGISACQTLLNNYPDIAVLLLTANKSESDRILGLEFGADDYIQKPFNIRELFARIKAVFRRVDKHIDSSERSEAKDKTVYTFSGWSLNISTRVLIASESIEVPITAGIYDLLLVFLDNPQRVLSRDFLLDATKHRSAGPFDRSIDVLVSRLRQKLGRYDGGDTLIKTIHGGGYMFTSKVSLS